MSDVRVQRLLAEPERQQCRGAAVPKMQPGGDSSPGLLSLLQRQRLPVPSLQVGCCLTRTLTALSHGCASCQSVLVANAT